MTKKEIAIRQALADYIFSEGCLYCSITDDHEEARIRLAKLLRVPKYKDGSGHNFYRYRTKAGKLGCQGRR